MEMVVKIDSRELMNFLIEATFKLKYSSENLDKLQW